MTKTPRPSGPSDPGLATRAVHAGEAANETTSLAMPIYQTSTFRFDSVDHGRDLSAAKAPTHLYTRWGNPTVRAAELALAELEGAEAALCFSSGMAAGSTAVMASVAAGDHVVAAASLYAGMVELFERVLPRFGVTTTFVDGTDLAAFEAAITDATKLIYVETPANPTLALTDLAGVARIAKARGLFTIADNTWASPLNQRPLELGIDAVVHSCTKSLGGHTDVVSGAALGSRAWIDRVWPMLKILGGCPGPNDAYLLLRGIRTFPLRAARQNETALAVARFLEAHPRVAAVHHPGLESHPQHALARAQMTGGFGGMLAFEVEGGFDAGRRTLEALRLVTHAVSLGGVETLAVHPASTTHGPLKPEERARAGISDGLIRVSIGLEDAADLIADLERALAAT
ncbi:MAG: trans-sulfuration enzyme family protein [Planctomycetota bacterium JB042]